MLDVIVIGSGPAGVTASLYLKRAGLNILNISDRSKSLDKSKIENFYGFLDKDGSILYDNGIAQMDKLSIERVSGSVLSVYYEMDNTITVKTKSDTYRSKYLVLAIGSPKKIDARFDKYLGYGVSICGHCDGPMYKNRTIYVTGHDNEELVKELKVYSPDVRVIDYDSIDSLSGNPFLECVTLKDGTEIQLDNIFLSTEESSSKLSFELGLMLDEKGYVSVNENCESSIKEVYACGDMVNDIHQVSSACYHGMKAALNIINKIKINKN